MKPGLPDARRPMLPATRREHASVSLEDLLDARDAYHVHLSNMENVVATAIGYFRFRPGDEDYPWPVDWKGSRERQKRTLSNSVVTDKSPGAVLVFVKKWADVKELRDHYQLIPRDLYLPDGRVVPTCVVEAEKDETIDPATGELDYPRAYVGGGYPLLTNVQGESRFGTISCLATDGELNFALTARHVAGRSGQVAETVLDGVRQRIGVSDHVQLREIPFCEAYPGFPGTHCQLNLDAGLIRIDSIADWTSQVYGIGQLGEPRNLTPENISLDLIGTPLRARGAGTGAMAGEIAALFYRYKSVGGLDYVADVLIGPRPGNTSFRPRHGDSGALWVIDEQPAGDGMDRAKPSTPLAVQWGGHNYLGDVGQEKYCLALGSFLSTVTRLLNVDLVRGWEINLPDYWGKPIHFQIAYYAWRLLPSGKLKDLLEKNLASIGSKAGEAPQPSASFFPLADAPDRWAFGRIRPQDAPNHSANLDLEHHGEVLGHLETPREWADFYEGLGTHRDDRGALPFRVGQVFDAMKKAVADGDVDRIVFAAGILAHYVGDVTMPLHGLADYKGEAAGMARNSTTNVHKFYDRMLLERQSDAFLEKMEERSDAQGDLARESRRIENGRDAAASALDLMRQIARLTPTETLFEVYARWWDSKRGNRRDYEAAWAEIEDELTEAAFLGSRFIGLLWLAAWGEATVAPEKADGRQLAKFFRSRTELPSVPIEDLHALLGYPEP